MTQKWYFVLLLVLLSLLVACQSDSEGVDPQDSTPANAAANPTSAANNATLEARRADIADVALAGETRLLLWIGPGEQPGKHSASAPGQIVLMSQNGSSEPVMDVPAGTSRVYACTESASSPDSRYFAFFIGGLDSGSLYLMDGINAPQEVAQTSALTCNGSGTFQYAADSSRFGYMDYAAIPSENGSPAGTLHIIDSQSRTEQNTFENVTGFDFGADFVSYVSFFSDTQGRPREAAIFAWRSGNADEISTLFAQDGCEFKSGQVTVVDADTLAILMGEACNGNGGQWSLYIVEIDSSIATLAASGTVNAAYSAITQASTVHAASDGSAVYVTYPNGLAFNRANLEVILLDDPQPGNALVTNAVMPRHVTTIAGIYDTDVNTGPVKSSDGRWLALVTNDVNNNAALNLLDLNAPDLPPRSISAGSQGAIISAMAFTPDNQKLLFVSGGHSGDNNSLFSVDLTTSTLTDTRVIRGRYTQQMIIAPDSQFVALGEWIPNYLGLTVLNLENEQSGVLFAGAEFNDEGRVSNQQFVYPLSWRR